MHLNAQPVTQFPVKKKVVFDYGARTDDNPEYIGVADFSTATSSDGWAITKFTYDGSNRPTVIETTNGIFDNAASLF